MVFISVNNQRDDSYSEWMRTKGGEIVVVSCIAREQNNTSLYAYAYVHSLLTFFRLYSTDEIIALSKTEISTLLLEYLKYAEQKLDITLNQRTKHYIPYISGYYTLPDHKIIAFTFGNSAVVTSDGDNNRLFKRPQLIKTWMNYAKISGKRLPVFAVKEYPLHEHQKIMLYPNVDNGIPAKGTENVITTFYKENECTQLNRQVYRAVITGRRHASQGQYCQDVADYRIMENGDIAAALSDGAGGGNCSEYGALMNVNAFLSCCEENAPLDQINDILLDRITDDHETLTGGTPDGAIQAYATLMGVFIKGQRLICLHIGDGIIYGRKQDGSLESISDAENLYVSNRTYFTIESDSDDHLHKIECDISEYDKILLLTDGVYNGYKSDDTDEGEICEKRSQNDDPVELQSDKPVDSQNDESGNQPDLRKQFIENIFSESDRDDFDDVMLAELIDTEEILEYGDDHSAILIDLRKKRQIGDSTQETVSDN